MSTRTHRARFICTQCKKKMIGAPGDEWRRGCDDCGGQLKPLPYGPARKRRN
jgi:hypothetical protein